MSSVVIAGIWALGVYGLSAAAWHKNLKEYQGYAIMLSIIAFVITWIVLSFFISLLINIIDTVYICFAMDRDHQTCSHVDIAEVYTRLPSVGPVIENPDGGLSYAAPTTAPVAQRV
jgi:hypothetical protein